MDNLVPKLLIKARQIKPAPGQLGLFAAPTKAPSAPKKIGDLTVVRTAKPAPKGEAIPKPPKGFVRKPPGGGWQAIPGGKSGGFRRKKGSGWEYWYPTEAKKEPKPKEKKKPAAAPPKAPKEKKPKKSTSQQAMDLAKELGIPAEKSGTRSISIGGAAAFDRKLGKWNYKKGPDARRTCSATKALKWLQDRKETQGYRENFKKEMDRRRQLGLFLTGNTYPYKAKISEAGGSWDRVGKVWLMPDRDSIDKMEKIMAKPTAPEAKPVKRMASPKQVNYAMTLIGKLRAADYGTFTTYGYQGTTTDKLGKMTSAAISAMIDHLRDELY